MNIYDSFPINNYTLRISAISACNLNCSYCNPKRIIDCKKDMSDKDILDIIKAGVIAGIRKISWTGGEPTMRTSLLDLVKNAKLLGIKNQSITTNGIIFFKIADELKKAGISKVNFSLDTLNRSAYKKICQFDGLDFVKKSIDKALKLFPRVKINYVVMKNNIEMIDQFIKFAERYKGKLIVRFLEIVPCGEIYKKDKTTFQNNFVPMHEIKARLASYGKLTPIKIKGDVPKSVYYTIAGLSGIYGINPNYSFNYHCDGIKCPKIRVNPQGFISNCTIKLKYVRDFRNKTLEEKIKMMKEIVTEKLNRNYKGFRHKQKYYDFWRFGIIPDIINKRFG